MEGGICPADDREGGGRLGKDGGTHRFHGFRLAMTIAGTTIGAGFASGREIWEFFAVYGGSAWQGIGVCVVLFSLCCGLLLHLAWQGRGSSYAHLLARFLPHRWVGVYDGLILVYLFSLTVVMFAAGGAVLQSHGGPYTAGVLLMAGAVFCGLLFNVRGLLALNGWLTPLMAVLLAVISLGYILDRGAPVEPEGAVGASWRPQYGVWASAIVYTAFNLLPMIGVLSAAAQTCTRRRELWTGAWLGGLLLGLLLAVLNRALLLLPPGVGEEREILLFHLAAALPLRLDGLVTLILWLAIYTTALSGMYGVALRLAALTGAPYLTVLSLLLLAVIPCSYFGFATLVKILYPIYGMAGLLFVGCLLLYPLRENGGADGHPAVAPPGGKRRPAADDTEQIGR